MTAASSVSVDADESDNFAIHHDLKCRAHELYDRHSESAIRPEFKLQTELPRVAYALSLMQKYHDGKIGESRSVRAAQVYLRALISFVRCT